VADTQYFVWPLWARYHHARDYGDTLGDANRPGYGYIGSTDKPFDDADVIWDFTGRRFLELDEIDLQARVGAGLSFPSLVFALDILPPFRRGYGEKDLWLPSSTVISADDPSFFYGLVPYFASVFPYKNAVSSGSPLYKYNFLPGDLAPKSHLDFFFHLSVSPPNLFAGRLDIAPGDPIPNDWYNRVRPFTFEIHDITRQRGGVTILNNVINSNNRENVLLDYRLNKPGRVTVQVFTLDGNLVKVLVRENQSVKEGYYRVAWDGTNSGGRPVARGMYFIRIVAPDIDEIRKVMVVK
jgi:hypothetical protein